MGQPAAQGQINLKLQRQQTKALTCPATELMYGGAAGGGKSHLLRVAAIRYACAVPGLQVYIFRRNYGDLKLNHIEGPTGFPALLGPLLETNQCSIVDHEIRFWNGSKIHFCHLQYTKSLQKYQGAEIHLLLMDELTHFTEYEYNYLRARVRASGALEIPEELKNELPRIISGTNPGSIGHVWVKRAFVSHGANRVWQTTKKEGGMKRCFIPARLEDNQALLEADPGYLDRLEGLGDALLVRALKEGDWNIVAGAMFGDAWSKQRHEMDAFAIPQEWKVWMGMDDGFAAPAACYWCAEDPDLKTVYVIAELYRAQMLAPEFAERVHNITEMIPRGTPNGIELHGNLGLAPLQGLMDSAAFSNTGQATISRGNQLKALGIKIKPVDKWPGSRIHRVQNFHRMLAPNKRDPEGMPGIRFFRNCTAAIETIPSLPRDDKNLEDVDTHAIDHAFDALTYALQQRDRKIKRTRMKGI